jgi:hypothetical protein
MGGAAVWQAGRGRMKNTDLSRKNGRSATAKTSFIRTN